MKKIKGLISTLFLSVASIGIFSASVITNNNLKEDNAVEVKKAEAKASTLYIAVASTWIQYDSNTSGLGAFKISITGGTYNGYSGTISAFDTHATYGANVDILPNTGEGGTKRGFEILRIKSVGEITSFELHDKSSNSGNAHKCTVTVPSDGRDFFVVNSKQGHNLWCTGETKQTGSWGYYEEDNSSETDTLFFVPSALWWSGYWEYEGCWPVLSVTKSDNSVLEIDASGFTRNDGYSTIHNNEDSNRKLLFYFHNVPRSVKAMTIYHGITSKSGNTNKFSITDGNTDVTKYLTFWTNGSCNLYCTSDAASPTVNGAYNYLGVDSKAFFTGSLADNSNIKSVISGEGGYTGGLPTEDAVFKKHTETVNANVVTTYRNTLIVDANDTLKCHTYDYLSNTSSEASTYGFNYNSTDNTTNTDTTALLSRIYVYDGDYSEGSMVIDKSGYVEISSGSLKFLRGGKVLFVRTSNTSSNNYLHVVFLHEDREDERSTDPQYLLMSYDSISSPDNMVFSYNNLTGRYETTVMVIGGESIRLYYLNASVETQFMFTLFEANGTGATATSSVITMPSPESITFYTVGWYPYNDSGSRVVKVFVDECDDSSTEEAVIAFGCRTAILKTCSCGTGTAEGLYDVYTNDLTNPNKVNILEGITFNDYVYIEYVVNGNDYTGLTRKAAGATDAYNKYLWIQYFHNNDGSLLPPSSSAADVRTSLEYQESNNIIVIIVASMSILAIASLGAINFLAIKKRNHKN